MLNTDLEQRINQKLNCNAFNDYAPNGLQVEGKAEIRKVVTGVTACQALIDKAVELQADAILVHHGYFWKNESPQILGIKKTRLKKLLENELNLFAYHLPLDGHEELGNNAQLGKLLEIEDVHPISNNGENVLTFQGYFSQPQTGEQVRQKLETLLQRNVLHCGDNGTAEITRIAWCSGGGQSFIEMAAQFGNHAFFTGEVSEQTIHIAREMGIHFFAAGHHATERYGIKALGEWLQKQYSLEVIFVDIPNPA